MVINLSEANAETKKNIKLTHEKGKDLDRDEITLKIPKCGFCDHDGSHS